MIQGPVQMPFFQEANLDLPGNNQLPGSQEAGNAERGQSICQDRAPQAPAGQGRGSAATQAMGTQGKDQRGTAWPTEAPGCGFKRTTPGPLAAVSLAAEPSPGCQGAGLPVSAGAGAR